MPEPIVEPKVEPKVEPAAEPKVEPKVEPKAKTAEEIEAEAEAVEAEIARIEKEKKDGKKSQDQSKRLEKAKTRLAQLKGEPEGGEGEGEAAKVDALDTRDLITLGKHDLAEDSEKAKILAKYKKGGLIKNYAEGLTHPGVKAEFDALDAKGKAKSVINENDSDDVKLKTEQEVIAQYRASGEVPTDPKLQKKIAEANLKEMGMK